MYASELEGWSIQKCPKSQYWDQCFFNVLLSQQKKKTASY